MTTYVVRDTATGATLHASKDWWDVALFAMPLLEAGTRIHVIEPRPEGDRVWTWRAEHQYWEPWPDVPGASVRTMSGEQPRLLEVEVHRPPND